MRRFAIALFLSGISMPAWADPPETAGPRDLCPDRPGLGTPACTLDAGRVVVELGLGDWTHDRTGPMRTDTILAGDALIRIGLNDTLEAQIGWTGYGRVRTRDMAAGTIDNASGTGDVTLALRRNFINPDGSGVSIAAMPYATLPSGGKAIGAGDWGAGLLVPMSFDLGGVSLALSPEIDAAVDSDGKGRHLGYGSVVGLEFSLTDALSTSTEISIHRDDDPAGHTTEALAGLSAGWQPSKDLQFDIGLNIGLNATSPDTELYFGIARRF
ncbi:transporter [Sphingomonas colocasiae]|uniref:Transporter n=1 Tax=Sphingomonas colocasiae TaxID=1848973 RepID=A0ABS7PNF3_9SPHN|nr:transporter [Sphingomonas colocasiae]MBY8822834.1 transporter [Sphingomonas colocasiae]